MKTIPKMSGADVAFGNIKHLPKWEDMSQEFTAYPGHIGVQIAESWFAGMLKTKTMPPIKKGVDRGAAMAAIRAILVSFEPSHEHKIAGAGYLINEWWDLKNYEIKT